MKTLLVAIVLWLCPSLIDLEPALGWVSAPHRPHRPHAQQQLARSERPTTEELVVLPRRRRDSRLQYAQTLAAAGLMPCAPAPLRLKGGGRGRV